MRPIIFFIIFTCFGHAVLRAQQRVDSVIKVDQHYITLSEIVVNNQLDVPYFINRVKNDTSFYKAFKNLRILNYQAINDVRMLDKKDRVIAYLKSKTRQIRKNNCRSMVELEKTVKGDIYNANGQWNYYTMQMYASLFFTEGEVCGETNTVKGTELSASNLTGMEKHKEQLKMLFFNPGRKIEGLPFISQKTAIFDPSVADRYDMDIDFKEFRGQPCYVFTIRARDGKKHRVVVEEMVTWFDENTFDILARSYSLKYDAGVYDFDVDMKVEMTRVGALLVPELIAYKGNWKAIFKKRERGIFTATLSDFSL